VATGNINAQLAARQTGIVNETGIAPIAIAKAPMTGRKVLVVATLLVISVKKIISVATAKIKPKDVHFLKLLTPAQSIFQDLFLKLEQLMTNHHQIRLVIPKEV